MERETGIEPATNSLGSCDSTTELLPLTAILVVRRSFNKRSDGRSRNGRSNEPQNDRLNVRLNDCLNVRLNDCLNDRLNDA